MNQDVADDYLPDSLPVSDIEAIVRLLGGIAGMSEPIVERRRALVNGLCEMVGADIWLWLHSRVDPATNFPTMFKLVDGGWRDDVERTAFLSALHDPEINQALITKQTASPHHTVIRQQLLSESDQMELKLLDRWTQMCGMRESITSLYTLGSNHFSGLGLHRRAGRAPFTPRERCIVHLITSQIDWLHRAETDVPANTDKLLDLTGRQREILVHLMGGDSRKQIADKLQISIHTVGDHMKDIYKHFNVTTRAELLSLFMTGGNR